MFNIVILDGHTVNPGDLSWDGLEELGKLTVHARTPNDLIIERARGMDAIITNKCIAKKETFDQLPDLRYIGLTATGVNNIDLAEARRRGISVTNVPGYSTMSVAQHVFALLLEMTNHTGRHAASVRAGDWEQSRDFCYWQSPLMELDGRTLGIVGFGQIGRAVSRIADALGMKVIAYAPRPRDIPATVKVVALEEALGRADVVSLHCPLTPETDKLINSATLAMMKPSAYLINTGRGGLVDETALAKALTENRLAGYGADVLSTEPPKSDNPLLRAPNAYITPHIAWASKDARRRLITEVTANLAAFIKGEKRNVVN